MGTQPEVPRAGATYRFAAGVAFGLMRLQRWTFDVEGLAHVPDRGGAVVAANHTSYWDFFTTGWGPYTRLERPVRILAKASLFEVPVFGRLMHAARHIPVDRGSGSDALRCAIEALRAGELVFVLPEQTISDSLDLLPFKTGAARMAIAAEVPLIPAISWGTHRFHSRARRLKPAWRLPVSVTYGEALHPSSDDDPLELTHALRARMQELLDRTIVRYPHGAPPGAWWVPERLGGGAPAHDGIIARHEVRERGWLRRRVG